MCAVDPQLVVEVGAHRALDRADDAVFVLDQPEDAGDGPVALARARDRLRTHGPGAGEAVAGIDAVAGDVVRRPAAELDALAPVAGGVVGIGLLRVEDAERGVDAVDRADLARREQLVDPGDRRMVAVHVALRDERSGLGRGRPDVERLVAAERERLLAEDGPHARVEAAEHLLAVEVRPGGEQHAVELVLGHHLGVVAVGPLAAVPLRPVLRRVEPPVGAGDDGHLGRRGRAAGMPLRDAPAADDSEPEHRYAESAPERISSCRGSRSETRLSPSSRKGTTSRTRA